MDTFCCVSLVDLLFAVVHKICIREIRAWILFCMVKLDGKVHMGVECYSLPTHNRDFKIQERGRRQIYRSRVGPVSRMPCSWREILS